MAERAHQQELHKLAYFDPLTGLSNRNHLLNESVNLLKAAAEASTHAAVLHMNCDHFKRVNDSLGHAKADHLLQLMADRASRQCASLHSGPTLIARTGGDEFAVVATGFDSIEHVTQFATRLQASMSDTISLVHSEVRVSISVGISCFPEDGANIEALMKKADLAVRNAKETGRNTICAYRPSMDTGIEDELKLEIEFLKAIDTGELELYYQPKVETKTGKAVGAEALIRWNHPERGLVSPGVFIPMAERTGLIANMDSWVMKTIFQQQQAWRSMGFPRLVTSFNVSAGQFCRLGFLNQLRDLTTTYEVDTSAMEIEITEGVLMQDAKLARRTLAGIKEMGFRIAIDDFGTGYSSLSYLKNFPVDVLKIDRSFVMDLETDENNRSLCNAIIALGKSLHLEVIAEGIETKEQFEFLKHAGCDQIQGYWVARPEPVRDFERFVLDSRVPDRLTKTSLVSANVTTIP
jgi:diguanylate cyclase (GGDEF)-like protein